MDITRKGREDGWEDSAHKIIRTRETTDAKHWRLTQEERRGQKAGCKTKGGCGGTGVSGERIEADPGKTDQIRCCRKVGGKKWNKRKESKWEEKRRSIT